MIGEVYTHIIVSVVFQKEIVQSQHEWRLKIKQKGKRTHIATVLVNSVIW